MSHWHENHLIRDKINKIYIEKVYRRIAHTVLYNDKVTSAPTKSIKSIERSVFGIEATPILLFIIINIEPVRN